MLLDAIDACALDIPFRQAFQHTSATRSATETLWVTVRAPDGSTGHGEGCPRSYVTGEHLAGALNFVAEHTPQWRANVRDLATLEAWVRQHAATIDAHPSAWAAVELAVLDLLARRAGCSVEALLGRPPLAGHFRYTAVLGDASAAHFSQALARYRQVGFEQFKIKLSGDLERDRAKVAALRSVGVKPGAVRADANNLWGDAHAATAFLSALDYPFMALEEPLRAGDIAGMSHLAATRGAAIILDESLLRADQLTALPGGPTRWIANLRVSKMGGLLRSLDMVERLRSAGMPVIVGAHVGETSLLTRVGLSVAHAAADLLVGQEGAFGTHLLERDVVDPPLMFGAGGMLEVGTLGTAPGWGLKL